MGLSHGDEKPQYTNRPLTNFVHGLRLISAGGGLAINELINPFRHATKSPADACPSCGNPDFFEVIGFESVPASGFFRPQLDGDIPIIDLHFDACTRCGLLRRRDFACPPDYTDRPRSTEKQLPAYQNELLEIIAGLAKKDNLIADIGSNDGAFLRLLRECGYSNIFGVEPALALAERSRQNGLRIEGGYFGPEIVQKLLSEYGDVCLVTCRHTLEHVPHPGGFVAAIRELLMPAGGSALIEVPDSSVIVDQFNFMELWDEHLYYFTEQTLGLLLNKNGLSVERYQTFPHLDTRNLLAQVSVRESDATWLLNGGAAEKWGTFSWKFHKFAESFRSAIAALARPVYLIGASHPQCNFVNFLDIGDFVDFMIDDDLEKLGKFPPIRNRSVRIITSEQFMARPGGGSVILTGFGYPGWTRKIVSGAEEKAMKIVDPKALVEH